MKRKYIFIAKNAKGTKKKNSFAYLACIFLVSFAVNGCLAQNQKIDSLLQLVKKDNAATSLSPAGRAGEGSDTNRVIHLNKLSWEYLNIGSYDTAVVLANQALAICNSPFEGRAVSF